MVFPYPIDGSHSCYCSDTNFSSINHGQILPVLNYCLCNFHTFLVSSNNVNFIYSIFLQHYASWLFNLCISCCGWCIPYLYFSLTYVSPTMRWGRTWEYSTINMVSLGHGIRNGFRGGSTYLLACSAVFTWCPRPSSLKQWCVVWGRSGREFWRRRWDGEVRGKDLSNRKGYSVVCRAQDVGWSWRQGKWRITAGACMEQSLWSIGTGYLSVRHSTPPGVWSQIPQSQE